MRPSAGLLSGEVAERYAVEGVIGRGGTALVYRARDRVRGIDVAIKLMREDSMGALSIERFLLEIRQTAKLPHPHIVPVLDSGQTDGRPYFVLPFMNGGTLREKLQKEKQLQFEDVITLGVTIAKALEFAHAHGVIHRDVKPENILYTDGQPCLADFGTARALERAANDPTTSTGVVRGTAAYMSPEQASGERDYDGRTDIYSLACVLYECIAGIQPFVGPSAQAIISQRLAHSPRPVSVYRPTVPKELEQVLEKATAMLPADRYQRAGEFAAALESVALVQTASRTTPDSVRLRVSRSRRVLVVGVIAAAAGIVAAVTARGGIRISFFSDGPVVDTTLVAISPVVTTGAPADFAGQELLVQGLRGWTGVSTVETFAMNDAIRRRGRGEAANVTTASLSVETIADLAKQLGAGRFIKSQLTSGAGLRSLYATLYDVRTRRDLYKASVPLPADSARWPEAYAALIDSLMLRGGRDDRALASRARSRNLPSFQAFQLARSALADWDLDRADSLFRASAAFDPTFTLASLWAAQVENWKGEPVTTWSLFARRAAEDTLSLLPQERNQARALAALASADYESACGRYRAMTGQASTDFIGWFGLGECRRLDRLVIRDATSRSGWRYRSSYHRAILAYEKAFQVLPSSYRGLQPRGFEQLRQLLFTSPRLRRGYVPGGPQDGFLSRPALAGDSLVFVPFPIEIVNRGTPLNDPAAEERAWQRNRRIFKGIVTGWGTVFQQSASVKEGVAISLEMLGDPAAADSFHAALSMTTDPSTQLRLLVSEAFVRMKFAVSENPKNLDGISALADSVLRTFRPASSTDAELLARLATLTGRCAEAERLAEQASDEFEGNNYVTPLISRQTRAFRARFLAGCEADNALPDAATALRKAGTPAVEARRIALQMLGDLPAFRFPADSIWIRTMTDTAGDYVPATERLILAGDVPRARQKLLPITTARLARSTGDFGVDGAVVDARLWLAIGDTSTATRLLDKALTELRYAPSLSANSFVVNQLRVGAIGRAMELRARISGRDLATRSRWLAGVTALWSKADPEVRQRLAGSGSIHQ